MCYNIVKIMAISNRAAFFDIDDTLIAGQTQKFLAITAFKEGKIGLTKLLSLLLFFARYKLGLINDVREVMEASYVLIKGWNKDEVNKLIQKCFDSFVIPNVYDDGKKLIAELKAGGYRIILISNTLQQIVDLLVKYLEVDGGIGTSLSVIDDIFDGKIERLVYGESKVSLLHEKFDNEIDFNVSAAYSDNKSDIPLLQSVGSPTAVNPDAVLKNKALASGWPIVYFK